MRVGVCAEVQLEKDLLHVRLDGPLGHEGACLLWAARGSASCVHSAASSRRHASQTT
jgi:hypothetical protein